MNTLISKLITAIFIAVFAVVVFLPVLIGEMGPTIPREAAIPGGVSAFLAVVLFLIVFMGLQVSTSFVSSKIVDVLSPLPLTKREISRIVFLCFIRIFDIPLIAAVAIFLGVYALIGGSILGGIISVTGIIITEIFALTLTVTSARFFYARIAGGGGRSGWQTFLRFAFMLVWILPTFAAYFVVNFARQIVQSFAYLTQGLSSLSHIMVVIYPFSYGFLVSYATFFYNVDYVTLGLSVTSSIAYAAIAYFSLKWVVGTVRKIGIGVTVKGIREAVRDTIIRPQIPWLGIIRKDMRVASRAPSYASLFLLPVIQTAVLALTFSSFSEVGLSTELGILTGISMITLLLPPTLLSIEGLGSAYTRHLPMRKRTLIAGKTLLPTITYMLSLAVLSIVALYQGKNFSMLAFGMIHSLSVAGAIMLELTILMRKFLKEGFAVGNIYSRISTYVLIVIPGYIVASIPLIGAFVTYLFFAPFVMPVFLAISATEFTLMGMIVSREK